MQEVTPLHSRCIFWRPELLTRKQCLPTRCTSPYHLHNSLKSKLSMIQRTFRSWKGAGSAEL
eukprot:261980-Pelagomonas_calceolata.AAC.5